LLFALNDLGCGHCRKLEPTYQELGRRFSTIDVVIGQIDCEKYKDVAGKYKVGGFPSIKFFDQQRKVADYRGDRSLNSLAAFVNERLSAPVAPKSGVPPPPTEEDKEERDPEMDQMTRDFLQHESRRHGIIALAVHRASARGPAVRTDPYLFYANECFRKWEYYGKVLERIEKHGTDHVRNELERLDKLKSKAQTDGDKKEIQMRVGVLKRIAELQREGTATGSGREL